MIVASQVIEPIEEIFGMATNDAAALSLTLFSASTCLPTPRISC